MQEKERSAFGLIL
jgi:hypothetical protein